MKLQLNRIEKPYLFDVENEIGAKIKMDAAPSIGGTDQGLRPMELVASGLAGCVAIDVLAILKKQRLDTNVFQIRIEGTRTDGIPSPFEQIHLAFNVDAHIDKAKLTKTIQLVIDKYCSVSASLSTRIKINFEIEQNETT